MHRVIFSRWNGQSARTLTFNTGRRSVWARSRAISGNEPGFGSSRARHGAHGIDATTVGLGSLRDVTSDNDVTELTIHAEFQL